MGQENFLNTPELVLTLLTCIMDPIMNSINRTHHYVKGWNIASIVLNNYFINSYYKSLGPASSHFPHENQTLPLCYIIYE